MRWRPGSLTRRSPRLNWKCSASGRHAAGTAYSLLGASGNLPIVYMTWLDGVGYKHSGARGLMGVDALANGVGGVLLLAFAWYCARRLEAGRPAPYRSR